MSNLKNILARATVSVKVSILGEEGKLVAKQCGVKSFAWNDVRDAVLDAKDVTVKVQLNKDTSKEANVSWKNEKGSEFEEFLAGKETKKNGMQDKPQANKQEQPQA